MDPDRNFASVPNGYNAINAITQAIIFSLKGFKCVVDWDGPSLVEVTFVDGKLSAGELSVSRVLSDGEISSSEEDTFNITLGDPNTEGMIIHILMAYIIHLKPSLIYGIPA